LDHEAGVATRTYNIPNGQPQCSNLTAMQLQQTCRNSDTSDGDIVCPVTGMHRLSGARAAA